VIAARIGRRRLMAAGAAAAGGLAVGVGWQVLSGQDQSGPALPAPLGDVAARLVDHEDRAVSFPDLVGRAALVFFGFTSCPDVCPTTLGRIATWLDALGDDLARLTPVFVTVDPARDDVATMAAYVAAFHPAIRGWTGEPAQIARAADALRVSYREVPLEGGGYTMDHTAGTLLFRATGRFMATIDPHENPDFALPKLRRAIGG
jgi:protein SCO1/2